MYFCIAVNVGNYLTASLCQNLTCANFLLLFLDAGNLNVVHDSISFNFTVQIPYCIGAFMFDTKYF